MKKLLMFLILSFIAVLSALGLTACGGIAGDIETTQTLSAVKHINIVI